MLSPKEKAASPGQGEAAQQTNHKQDHTSTDPLIGWHSLAATAKKAQKKRVRNGGEQ